ncbi:GGDEF domain-containing protein [Mycolicibacterium sp. S2-37]|uniref:GGDEF domain-containing protein n=1 Tax=Mycolicibacterium sp. S2-37 TaxID=2810297 RepID=UPI001A94CE16|nr:GGDEF domain-containing protein [Mycolicibacterium sp. S2-37]MBO0678856.1 GGDEF domain-containing protein [Mycolicibacterium sp. S2-37]
MFKAVRHYWRQPEHFYWLTSFLAAREAQLATCRLIAVFVSVLGIVPLIMQWSAAGPQSPAARLIGAGVTVSCLVLALGWLRNRWPTPKQSVIFVAVTAADIAAGCLIMSDPRAGLVLAAGFAVLGGYIALFHTAGYLLFALLVAEATTLVLTARLWEAGDEVFAVTALLIVTAVNVAVPFACHLLLYAFDIDVDNADIDPLTGLLNRAAIYRAAGAMVARCRDDDQRLVLVLLRLDNMRLLGETDGIVAIERARVAIAQTLRETTRHNAFVARIGDDDFLIADTFSTPDSFPLVERVRKAIAATPPRVTASFGVVSTPMRGLGSCPPDELLDELIASASTAMDAAREAGGNQARYVTCDRPSVLGNVDPRGIEDL